MRFPLGRRLFILFIIKVWVFTGQLMSQPDPPPGGPGGGDPPVGGSPIDGGLGILLALALIYGLIVWFRHDKKSLGNQG